MPDAAALRDDCHKTLIEIDELVLAKESKLCWAIGRELADFTVAFIVRNGKEFSPAGTGTLVSFREAHYFLTAAHVWEGALRKSDLIWIPLRVLSLFLRRRIPAALQQPAPDQKLDRI